MTGIGATALTDVDVMEQAEDLASRILQKLKDLARTAYDELQARRPGVTRKIPIQDMDDVVTQTYIEFSGLLTLESIEDPNMLDKIKSRMFGIYIGLYLQYARKSKAIMAA